VNGTKQERQGVHHCRTEADKGIHSLQNVCVSVAPLKSGPTTPTVKFNRLLSSAQRKNEKVIAIIFPMA
jgi:hypothetical protein